jgi:hypothetical protein
MNSSCSPGTTLHYAESLLNLTHTTLDHFPLSSKPKNPPLLTPITVNIINSLHYCHISTSINPYTHHYCSHTVFVIFILHTFTLLYSSILNDFAILTSAAEADISSGRRSRSIFMYSCSYIVHYSSLGGGGHVRNKQYSILFYSILFFTASGDTSLLRSIFHITVFISFLIPFTILSNTCSTPLSSSFCDLNPLDMIRLLFLPGVLSSIYPSSQTTLGTLSL